MCKFWRKFCLSEKRNHHFPELSARYDIKARILSLADKKSVIVSIIALNVIAFGFFVLQSNQTAAYSYQISGLEKELASLQEQNNNLNLDYVQLQSMDKIVSGAKNLNLVPVDNLITINALEGAIAYNVN